MNGRTLRYSVEQAAVQIDALVDAAVAGELVVIEIGDGIGVQLVPMDTNPFEAGDDGR